MQKNRRAILLLPLLIVSAFYLYSHEVVHGLDRYFIKHADQGTLSGAILIVKDAKILLMKGYGLANHEFEIPNAVYTKFRIASITKTFTAAAIMQLHEKKLLQVNDSVASYIKNFPHHQITIHHLLTHSSGIPNYYTHFADIQDCNNIGAMVHVMGIWPLDFEPGANYRYSNSGYLILAYIIEKVSGMSYAQYIAEHIFKPLGMNSSGSVNTKNCAQGYILEPQGITKAPSTTAPLTLVGNGDLYSSVEDMYKWDKALFSGKVISKKSLDLMLTPHNITSKESGRAHGYGWFIDKINGKKYVEYTGALRGFLSKHIHFISDNISIIILTNLENQDQFCQICDEVMNMLVEC